MNRSTLGHEQAPELQAEFFQPMQRLLDDADIASLRPPARTFRKMRRDRRRIYLMYVGEFRTQAIHSLLDRFAVIGRNDEWDQLGPAVERAGKFFRIWFNLHLAWAGHGIGVSSVDRVRKCLRQYQALTESA
jgi:hypothetical protein